MGLFDFLKGKKTPVKQAGEVFREEVQMYHIEEKDLLDEHSFAVLIQQLAVWAQKIERLKDETDNATMHELNEELDNRELKIHPDDFDKLRKGFKFYLELNHVIDRITKVTDIRSAESTAESMLPELMDQHSMNWATVCNKTKLDKDLKKALREMIHDVANNQGPGPALKRWISVNFKYEYIMEVLRILSQEHERKHAELIRKLKQEHKILESATR